jgi:ribosome maturation factor RimP
MTVVDTLTALVVPLCGEHDVELYDIEYGGGVVRIAVHRPGGVDIGTIQSMSRRISRALDELDPIPGQYTLEVSSAGLERVLRTPTHYRGAVGMTVAIKTKPHVEGERRVAGVIAGADDEGVDVRLDEPLGATRRLRYDDIDKARTVFEWNPTPKPGKAAGSRKAAPKKTKDKSDRTETSTAAPQHGEQEAVS